MAPKCRYPVNLGLNDFLTFMKDFLQWLADEVGKPDYRASVVAGLDVKFAALETAIVQYSTLKSHVPELHKLLEEKGKAIRTALQSMKTLLPVFFPDPAIVGEFGLAVEIKLDFDDLYVIGQSCMTHWDEVSADPAYAEVAPDFAELQVVFDDFVAARTEWVTADQALDEAQNTILATRADCEEQEREIFNYYRAKHPNPKDEWWTDSPWGRTGESGGPSPEIGVPTHLTAVFGEHDVRITWDPVADVDGYQLVHTMFPPLFLSLYQGEETEFLHEAPDHGTHYYMVRAKVGDNYGDYCEAVSAEVVVEPPAPPTNLNHILNPDNTTKATWESAPGVVYDGCSIFVVDVPNGSPVPSKPAEPLWDELIVYSMTLDVLAPGMTRYVWVTGTKDGSESAATGPASVSN